ncbi:MAG: hypothetical protein HMLKMBBP_00364 [Planctomycetes bacterium]|nr:hypothetical protein [Planctomycetota bacterium]
MKTLLAAAACLLVASCTSPDGNGGETVIDATEGAQSVTLPTGRTLAVRMKGNATTGFTWTCDASGAPGVTPVGTPDYVSDMSAPGMTGVGGTWIFRFRAATAGKGELKFAYARGWERDVPPIKSSAVTVTVQ